MTIVNWPRTFDWRPVVFTLKADMNTTYLLKRIAELAPELKSVRVDDLGKGIFALHCQRDGMARCVQFTASGIYGTGYGFFPAPLSIDTLAIALAMELNK